MAYFRNVIHCLDLDYPFVIVKMYKLFKRFLLFWTFWEKYLECIKFWKPPVMADNKGYSLIDVSLDGKENKKKHLSVVPKLPGATKNESIYFRLFTLYFWLWRQKKIKEKKKAIHELQEPRPQLLFHGTRFFSFLKTHTPSALAASADKTQRREKGGSGGDKTKHKNSNICSRFQPDSLMWITQHFVPWPWRTKGVGGGMPRERSEMPREASANESTPARFAELELLSPWQGEEVPPGHPAPHATWTVIVSAQRWLLDKRSRAAREWNVIFGGVHCWDRHAICMQIRVRQITIGVPFKETGKCRDKSVQQGVDEYLSILPEDANI